MSIRIEVTGNSTEELADKLLALAAVFNPTAQTAAPAEDKPKRAPAKAKPETPKAEEGKTDTPAATEEATGAATTASAAQTAALDFDKDVAPVVIATVQAKGKPFVEGVLQQFGVERASQVPDGQLGEFLALLQA